MSEEGLVLLSEEGVVLLCVVMSGGDSARFKGLGQVGVITEGEWSGLL